MKKKPHNPPKPKEFSASPFTALKAVVMPEPPASSPPPTPPVTPSPAPEESDDDLELFLRAVSDIRPLKSEPRGKGAPGGAPRDTMTQRARLFEEEDAALFLASLEGLDFRFQPDVDDEEGLPQYPGTVSRMKQVRQGLIRIRLELDLHGLTRDEALESLGHFISGAWRREIKAVLVITGKGNNSPGEPVLQSAVAGWLRDNGKKMVLEFAPAPRQMGGTGAFVVFLRELEQVVS